MPISSMTPSTRNTSDDTPSLTPSAGITASARTPFSDTPIATFTDPGSDINPDDFTAMVSDANGDDLTAAVAWDSTNNDFAVKISGAMEFSGDQTLTLEVDNNAVPGGASTLADIPATVSETTPAVPQYLQATAVATGEIDLSWDAAAGAATYIVSRAPAGSQVFQTIACVSAATSYADDYLPAHTTYQYQVTAANTAGANNSVLASAPSNTALTQTLDTPPVALDDGLNSDGSYAYSVCHDRTLAITASYNGVLANDHDADYDSLTAQLVGQAQHGNVTLNANGTFTYTPDAGYVGPDSFTYGVYDGFEHSNVATVSIDVTNTPPTAQGATFTDYPGLSLNGISLSAYAADGDYDPRTYSLVSGLSPDEGTLTFHAATGTFDYTAPSDFVGSVTFAWKVNDGAADSNVATATINVTDIAPPMHAVNDVYTASVGYPLQLTGNGAQSITYNDANTSCATVVMVGNPAYGSLATDQYGHWFYTPDSGVTAPTLDTFTYCLQRNGQTSNTATVTILVLPVGFSGRAGDYISTPCYGYWDGQNWYTNTLSWAVHQGQELSVLAGNGLMKYATAADNPNDTVAVSTTGTVATAQGGTVNINADGGFTYTPAAGYVGPDTFNFTLVDTSTNVSSQFSGMVNVTDAAPAAAGPLSVWTSQGQNATITPSISDPDNYTAPPLDTLTPAIVQQPAHGSVAINSQGNFVYTPDANFTGVDVFTYDVNDGALNSNAATVQINVAPACTVGVEKIQDGSETDAANDGQSTTPTIFRITRPDANTGSNLTVYYTLEGTAVPKHNYTAPEVRGLGTDPYGTWGAKYYSVVIPQGQSSVDVVIPTLIANDTSARTLIMQLFPDQGEDFTRYWLPPIPPSALALIHQLAISIVPAHATPPFVPAPTGFIVNLDRLVSLLDDENANTRTDAQAAIRLLGEAFPFWVIPHLQQVEDISAATQIRAAARAIITMLSPEARSGYSPPSVALHASQLTISTDNLGADTTKIKLYLWQDSSGCISTGVGEYGLTKTGDWGEGVMATVALRATAATAGVELPFSVTVMHFQDQTELPFRSEEDIINFYHCTLVVTLR